MQTNNILPIEEIDPEFATLIKQVANKELPAIVFNDKVFKTINGKVVNEIVDNILKIGRNELCPCNSGRKYKKCCGSNL
jgi:uncharacterized protein YecA (UPF0149 family)